MFRRCGVYASANGQPFLAFGLFVFGIIQLHAKTPGAGVIACIQGLAGKILGVHSRTVVKTPGRVEGSEKRGFSVGGRVGFSL